MWHTGTTNLYLSALEPRLPWSKLGHLARVLNLIWYITLQSDVFRSSPYNGLVIASSECACNVKGSGQHEGG